jgi:ubiquinone/menaquinone biosynthesis C-methylase UbiE
MAKIETVTKVSPDDYSEQNDDPRITSQGHWMLSQMGKRVLRPGGVELSREMLAALNITPLDDVVEFAPGLGKTAELTLRKQPDTYTAIERDKEAAETVRCYLKGASQTCRIGRAEETGLTDEAASVVYCEAMLTMHPDQRKSRIMAEAHRILVSGGRFGIHELGLVPDDVSDELKQEMKKIMSHTARIDFNLVTIARWQELLEEAGFNIIIKATRPMHLLEPARLIKDEGLGGALRFVFNLARNPEIRTKVLAMREMFKKYEKNISAIMLVGSKKGDNHA